MTGIASSNPTTGFSWIIDANSSKKCGPEGSIVVEQDYKRNANGAGMSGVGGTTTFTVKATSSAKAGSSCLVGFHYAQPWTVGDSWESEK